MPEPGFIEADRQEGTQGIIEDALPAGDRGEARAGTNLLQQRNDDGGPGDHQERGKNAGLSGRKTEHEVQKQEAEAEGDRGPHEEEAQNQRSETPELTEGEQEAAFKEDKRHGERDEGLQNGSQQLVWKDEAGTGTQKETERKQEEDAGKAEPVGEQVGHETEAHDQDELLYDGEWHGWCYYDVSRIIGEENFGGGERMRRASLILGVAALLILGGQKVRRWWHYRPDLLFPGEEKFLANLRQITFGGVNAEAYPSPDGRTIIFQSTRGELEADQIFLADIDGQNVRMISTGKGRHTCGFFVNEDTVLFSSTIIYSDEPPQAPRLPGRYAWPIFPEYELFLSDLSGEQLVRLTHNWGYDAEATVHWRTGRIVFTSFRNGDLDLYVMNADGSGLRRLTYRYGYEGGAFFSHDGRRIVFRAYYPATPQEREEYRRLLEMNLVSPPWLEIFTMDALGGDVRQVTELGVISFAPYYLPDDSGIIFSSEYGAKNPRDFNLFVVGADGSNLMQVTTYEGFDGFPIFLPDGRRLLFVSSRGASEKRELNVFMADWKGPGRPTRSLRVEPPLLGGP